MKSATIDALLAVLGDLGRDLPTQSVDQIAEILDRAVEESRKRWPGIALTDEEFARHAGMNLPSQDVVGGLQALCLPDLFLAKACSLGDPRAIEAFDATYLADLRSVHHRFRSRAPGLDDLVQVVRAKLFSGADPRIQSYNGQGDLRTWVRVTAARTLLDMTRSKAASEIPVAQDGFLDIDAPGDDPEVQYLKAKYRTEFRLAFEQAAREIAPEDRNVLRFHYTHGMSIDEIAAARGIHRATAARQLNRARENLLAGTRECLVHRLALPTPDLESVMRMIQSQLHVTIDRVLRTVPSEPER